MMNKSTQPFEDYYELLGVTPDASEPTIQQALDAFRTTLETRLNNPLQMKAADHTLKEVIPLIKQNLLSDTNRLAYDQLRLKAQQPDAGLGELADDEGLDDRLPQPFFFNPFDNYDIEDPAQSLRQIGMKLDNEWATTFNWIRNTSRDTHVLVGYLAFAAGRKQLSEHIGGIIKAISEPSDDGQIMNINEGIERCINILHPDISRPKIGLQESHFNRGSYTLEADEYLPNHDGEFKFTLFHDGSRGCAFGQIVSRTAWVSFLGGASSQRFAVLPDGTEPRIGPSEQTYTIVIHTKELEPYANHTAILSIQLENHGQMIETPLIIHFHLQARPPEVVFEAEAPIHQPIEIATIHRGDPIITKITARNKGDEKRTPLAAHISTSQQNATVKPMYFHANETITFSINTRDFPTGQAFKVDFPVNYSSIPGASGPAAITIQGATYPTFWQSVFRQKKFSERLLVSLGVGLSLSILFAIISAISVANWWVSFVFMPLACLAIITAALKPIVTHIKRAGNNDKTSFFLSLWLRLLVPCAYGLIIATTSQFAPDLGSNYLGGALIGLICGFMLDDGKPKTIAPNMPIIYPRQQ